MPENTYVNCRRWPEPLFIEGCQDIIQTPLETPVTDAVSKIKRNGHLVVAEGNISA